MHYIVAYAKLINTRYDGVILSDIYFGGWTSTLVEANNIARSITKAKATQSKQIIPRIYICGPSIIEALEKARQDFNVLAAEIYEAEAINAR